MSTEHLRTRDRLIMLNGVYDGGSTRTSNSFVDESSGERILVLKCKRTPNPDSVSIAINGMRKYAEIDGKLCKVLNHNLLLGDHWSLTYRPDTWEQRARRTWK